MPNVSATSNIPYEHWQQIQTLIKDEQYKSMSDFIRASIEEKLAKERKNEPI